MKERTKPRTTVTLGGRKVPMSEAALLAAEADRRGVLPRKVRRVQVPEPAPSHVLLASQRVSVRTAALLAEEADARGILLEALITELIEKKAQQLGRSRR